jgi:phosphoglycolate phosphatase-like HAD superfamily hydrolase
MIQATYIPCPIAERTFEPRRITYAFHDIDGTHSLIRDWPPVMSIVLHEVIQNGIYDGYDSEDAVRRLADRAGSESLPETDAFCVESAGLSALTQMEWAIRRAIEEGSVRIGCDPEANAQKARRIYAGEEHLDYITEPAEVGAFLNEHTPRLFRFYEKVLNAYCRDRNLEIARREPERFCIPGSMEFLQYLKENGVVNYFVTGAVVEQGRGMMEEVETLGYPVGHGKLIEEMIGSTWTEKLPKDVIMKRLLDKLGICGEQVLVVGDGRSEISAGAEMGALTLGRLAADAHRQRELQKKLGVHLIVEDYTDPDLYRILQGGQF